MKKIITLFAFFIMMLNVNAQTCEIGFDEIIPQGDGTVGAQSNWLNGAGVAYGRRIVADKSGTVTKIGFYHGQNGTTFKTAIYSISNGKPSTVIYETPTTAVTSSGVIGFHPNTLTSPVAINSITIPVVDQFYINAGDTIAVALKHNGSGTNQRRLMNITPYAGDAFKFSFTNPYSNAFPPNPETNPLTSDTYTDNSGGLYCIFVEIEDCVMSMPVTIANGNASDEDTWLYGNLPTDGDSVIVQHEVTWDISSIDSLDTYAWMLVTDSLTMASGSSIQTNVLVDSLGNSFAETVRITNPGNNLSIDGAGTSWFDDLLVDGDSLFFEKPVEIFNLELESDCHVVTTNLSMEGKTNIPSSIYWDDATVDVTFSGTVPIVDRFSISSGGTWRIQGNPGTGITIEDWDANPGHFSSDYSEADYPNYNFTSPALYYEPNPSTNKDVGWISPTGDAHLLDSIGFYAYYNGGTYETTLPVTLVTDTFTFSGLTNTTSGNATADGWELLRNPFACAIDLDELIISGVDSAVWTYDHILETNTAYSLISGLGTDGRTDSLATGQAFWVKVKAGQTGSVSIPPSAMIKTSDVEYRSGGDDPMAAIEIKIFGPVEGAETIDEFPWTNTFVIPTQNATVNFDDNDVLTLNSNSSEGNMTICTTSSDGIHLAQNFVPNDQTIIVDVWASTIVQNSEFHPFQINVPAEYQNWCISYDQVGWGFDLEEEWIPVVNGEIFILGFFDPINQNSQDHIFRLKLEPNFSPAAISLTNSEINLWEPGQESTSVTFVSEGNWETISWEITGGTFEENTNGINATFTEPGTYTVTAEVTGQCATSASVAEEIIIECVPMVLEFPSTYFEVTLSENGEASISIDFEYAGLETLAWEIGENGWMDWYDEITGNAVIEMSVPGTYECLISGYNDCGQIHIPFTIVVNDFVGIEEHSIYNVSIFPNPSDGNTINLSGISDGKILVDIYDSTGKLVHRSSETLVGTTTISFDNKLSMGVYYVRINGTAAVSVNAMIVR